MLLGELVAKRQRVVSVSPTVTVRTALDTMIEADVGCAAVVDGGKLVGIVTERDLVRRVLAQELQIDETQVLTIMTKAVVSGRAEEPLGKAARLMREHHIRHLPVLDKKGALLGVISIRDLLREEIQDMRDYIGEAEG